LATWGHFSLYRRTADGQSHAVGGKTKTREAPPQGPPPLRGRSTAGYDRAGSGIETPNRLGWTRSRT